MSGLASQPRPPRTRRLTPEQLRQLEQVVLNGAKAAGFPDDTWTCPRVQQWIKAKLSVDYHVDHLSKLLRALGLTTRYPKRRAMERDESKIEAFRTKTWTANKRGAEKTRMLGGT